MPWKALRGCFIPLLWSMQQVPCLSELCKPQQAWGEAVLRERQAALPSAENQDLQTRERVLSHTEPRPLLTSGLWTQPHLHQPGHSTSPQRSLMGHIRIHLSPIRHQLGLVPISIEIKIAPRTICRAPGILNFRRTFSRLKEQVVKQGPGPTQPLPRSVAVAKPCSPSEPQFH